MKLAKCFRYFLEQTVNLNRSRIEQLDDRVAAITNYLSQHAELGPEVNAVIAQGSYAHKTIIKPVGSAEFDADVLLFLSEQEGWQPADYVNNVYRAFRDSERYAGMVSRRTRCVVVDYANEFHIDVVPFLLVNDQHYVTNRSDNTLELTNPEAFNAWLDERDRIATRRLVEVIRLMKYLRDYKRTFSIKSVILTTLLAEQVTETKLIVDPTAYRDLPTALVTIIKDLNAFLRDRPVMPLLRDPTCPSVTFNHRWDQEQYANFRNCLARYAEKMDAALHEADKQASLRAWQDIFGPSFVEPPAPVVEASLSLDASPTGEEKIADLVPVRLNPRFNVKLVGRVKKKHRWDTYDLATRGNKVAKQREILFQVVGCTVPEPYEVWWKVRNYGEEAREANCLRGQIVKNGGARKLEPTAYRGEHYVEVYIVKDGACVAQTRHRVSIF